MPVAARSPLAPRFHIGTAGWTLPRDYVAQFGNGDSVLARYATRFNAVEINSSFYRPHRQTTYARWAATVPADFRFSVKMPQEISHVLRLRGTSAALERFLAEIQGLGNKLGGLLLQLPPSLDFDARVAASFFGVLRRRTRQAVTCEPRHPSWFSPAAEALLQRHGIGRTAADPARVAEAATPGGDRRWPYFRWHGTPRIYYSAYDDQALQSLAAQAQGVARGHTPWIIFDNTALGAATGDALRLAGLLAKSP